MQFIEENEPFLFFTTFYRGFTTII